MGSSENGELYDFGLSKGLTSGRETACQDPVRDHVTYRPFQRVHLCSCPHRESEETGSQRTRERGTFNDLY